MQHPINEDVHLGKTVDPNDHTGKVKSIDICSYFNEITSKVNPTNHHMNWNSVDIYLPIQIKKSTNVASDLDATTITVNNFFAHWIMEIDIQ